MFVIKNALKNLVRNKGRNILLAVIILAMITASVVGLAINNTANAIINDYKARFSSQVVISLNRDAITSGTTVEPITAEMYLEFGNSEYLSYSIYTASAYVYSEDVEPIANDFSGFNRPDGGGGFPGGDMGGFRMASGDFLVYGDYWDDFDNGNRWILDSDLEYYEYDLTNACFISKKLADANPDLVIGSTIMLESRESDEDGADVLFAYELEIVGIYYDNTDSFGRVNRNNEILTNFATAAAPIAVDGYDGGITINATYYLKDPNMLADFEAEVRTKGLPSMYSVTTDSATYDAIVRPVESMKSITTTFLIVILVLGGLILSVLAAIAIRERKYEIGTLRAIGMKKSKVLLGLLSEFLVITLVCTIVGFMVGFVASQPVSDMLLDQQISSTQTTQFSPDNRPGGMDNFNPDSMQQEARPGTEALSEMKVKFDFATILEVFGIAILLAGLPTAVSAWRITRYEPIKILSDRT